MSIETRIQAINDHLVDDYKVLRLAGADLSGVNKNILNLKQSWQERLLYFMREGTQVVWNNWNKVTGSGTTLSLNNTEEAPMSLTYKGNTSQSGTPTPTSPIPVQVVSGDNSIKVEGKNLIPITYAKIKSSNTSGSWNNNVYSYNGLTFTVNEDLSVVINGTASGNTAFNLIGTTNLFVDINISNGNYVLSGSTGGEQNMSTWGIYMAIKHSDNTTETQFCYNGDLAFTKVEGDTFFPVIRIGSGTVCNNIEIKPMIRKSGTNSTYQPYTSSSYPISLGVENLLNSNVNKETISGVTFTPIYNDDSTLAYIVANGTATANLNYYVYGTSSAYYSIPAGTYYLSDSAESGESNTTYFTYLDVETDSQLYLSTIATKTRTYSTSVNIRVRIVVRSGAVLNNVKFYPMLEKGNTQSSYTPYGKAIELCKIGTYQDKIFKNTPNTTDYDSNLEDNLWYLKKEIGKVVLNGSETWQNTYGASLFGSELPYKKIDMSSLSYNNYYTLNNIQSGLNAGLSNGQYTIQINISVSVIYIKNTNYTTPNDFKTWLSTHNTEVYYPLETPTYETITDTTLISQLEAMKQSYDSQTNISQTNNDLPFELNITALSNE